MQTLDDYTTEMQKWLPYFPVNQEDVLEDEERKRQYEQDSDIGFDNLYPDNEEC